MGFRIMSATHFFGTGQHIYQCCFPWVGSLLVVYGPNKALQGTRQKRRAPELCVSSAEEQRTMKKLIASITAILAFVMSLSIPSVASSDEFSLGSSQIDQHKQGGLYINLTVSFDSGSHNMVSLNGVPVLGASESAHGFSCAPEGSCGAVLGIMLLAGVASVALICGMSPAC